MFLRKPFLIIPLILVAIVLAACSGTSQNLNKYYEGRTLHLNVVDIERVEELRYSTIDPEQVVRSWRLATENPDTELVLVHLKVENHSAVSAIVNIDQQAAELGDFFRGTYFPLDIPNKVVQDLRGTTTATVRMKLGQCFDPNRMVIDPETTVTWINLDPIGHYLVLDPDDERADLQNTAEIAPQGSFVHKFSSPGVLDYECSAEDMPSQEAQIVVEQFDPETEIAERSMVFLTGPFELLRGEGIDGWMVFEVPKDTKFRYFRWRASDSITINF